MLSILSCNPSKKIEKAKQIVLTNTEAFNAIGNTWQGINPCVNDTLIQNTHDTLNIENTFFAVKTDTLKQGNDTIVKTIVKTVKIVEKVAYAVTDNRALNIAKDTIVSYKIKLSEKVGQLLTSGAEKELYKKLVRFWKFSFIILLLFTLYILLRRVWKNLKSKYTIPF